MNNGIKVSLDGGITYQDAPCGVRIMHEKVAIPGEDGKGQLHFNHTDEGFTTDVWATRDVPLDHNIGSERTSIAAIVERLVDENA